MKLRIYNGTLKDLASINIDELDSDLKGFLPIEPDYYIELKEKDGYLVPTGYYSKPRSKMSVRAKFEIIYKDYALANYEMEGIDLAKLPKETKEIEVEIRGNKIIA